MGGVFLAASVLAGPGLVFLLLLLSILARSAWREWLKRMWLAADLAVPCRV